MRHRRRELRRGQLPRARRHGAPVPRRQGDLRPQLRPHPRDQPQEAGRAALTFADPATYDAIGEDDRISVLGLADLAPDVPVRCAIHKPDGTTVEFEATHTMNDEQIEWFKAGQRPEHHPGQAQRPDPDRTRTCRRRGLLGIDHVQLAMPPGEEADADAERLLRAACSASTRVPKPRSWRLRGRLLVRGPVGAPPPRRAGRLPARPPRPTRRSGRRPRRCVPARRGRRRRGPLGRRTSPACRRVHTDDPFGNRIELIQAVGPSLEAFATMAEHSIFPLALVDNAGTIVLAVRLGRAVLRLGPRPSGRPQLRQGRRARSRCPAVIQAFTAIDDAFEITPWGGVGMPVELVHADGTEVRLRAVGAHDQAQRAAVVRGQRPAGRLRASPRPGSRGHGERRPARRRADTAGGSAGADGPRLRSGTIADRWTGDGVRGGGRARRPTCWAPTAARRGLGQWRRARTCTSPSSSCCRRRWPRWRRAEGYDACWVHPWSCPATPSRWPPIVVWRDRAGGADPVHVDHRARGSASCCG